ncbi:SIR2 family protein [Helicobacter pylori]|uniref:SIR2 family protein n=1 Tax=Helicobacter pylori TaxID=210 RepID=UPI000FDD6B4E|nr:SIR2 family protein [Helicobacter pylori]RVZ12385.1 SIR2 family protein [Helicobacter pylori]RVZ54525.1 SIR2 family protein [Helicobacter pylori]
MNSQQYKEFIKTSIDNIRKAHNENYLSIFAGAGISAESKLPKWGDLINELQKCLYGETKKNEDYLVLAEKFYNQFGESFYYQTLKSLIPDSAKKNDLHLEIVKLNIKNLITTNWDNLFEQAINEEGRFFNIIKSDKDIGSSTGFAKFIKMHGSLDENNIVFKEQDYLEYSNNFPLIENYIKGVFSTDTVILLGYSLSDQNVKQIISWVNSHLKSVKPIYFIKTAKEFDRIEFEFYKNKNIHILYTQELFEKKGHYEELLSFLKEIKKDKPKDISKSYNGIISSTKQLRKIIFNFDYNAMKKRISEIISLKSSSVLNELEKAFLLYHLGQGIQSFETLKINSKQAFRERNYDVWYISLYNMYNIPLFYGYSDENNKKLEKYHEERISIDLNESFYELPFYKREQLKYLRDIGTTLDTNLIKAYQLKEKALKDLEIWSSSDSSFSFNNNQNKAYGIFKKTLSEYFSFLIINGNQEKFFEQMTEIFFSFMAIFQIQEKRRNNNEAILITLKSEQIYCILKYFDNKILMQKLNQYFQKTNIIFKTERDIDLIGIFKNISSQFVNIDIFETEFSRLFKNFLVLSAWIELDQNAFNAIIEICQEKIDEDLLRNSYDSMGYFITKQWNKFKTEIKTEIKFSILDRILFSFIRKLTENFSGYLIILESSPRCMQNLLFILQQYNIEYNIELDLIQQALINTLIKEIMELPNDTQIFISNYLICDLFPITKNNDGVNQNVKNFLLNIWEKNQNRKTIQEDEYYLLLTSNMHRIGILNSEQYQKIFLELKNKYMDRETAKKFNNEQPIHEQLLKQAMQEDALDRMLALLKDCENGFKKE